MEIKTVNKGEVYEMRKSISILLSILIFASILSILTGCSGQSAATNQPAVQATAEPVAQQTEEATTQAPVVEPVPTTDVVITLMASQDWIQDAELTLGEKFTQETGIKIDYQIVPADQYQNLLMTKLNTGECTDIFCAQSGMFDIVSTFNIEKNGLDLSGESWVANVEKPVADELSVNGKIYGQPIQDVSSISTMAYNKKIFSELGLQIPTTYAEFSAVCDAILAAGKIPIYECVSDIWHHVLWFIDPGVQIMDADPTIIDKLNSNQVVFEGNATLLTVLSQVKEMADKGYWGDNYMSNTYADTAKNIASGDYVMTSATVGFGAELNAFDPNFPADDIGFFVKPLADNQTGIVAPTGPSRFIFSGSANVEAAKLYLDYMATDESLKFMVENVAKFNKLPYSNSPITYSETIKEFFNRYPTETSLQISIKYLNPQWMDIGTDMSALLLGEVTPEEILRNIDKRRAEQASAAKDDAWK
jgi:raffinose/stachyose/melibiose transport system substrate-binding protein